jgi:hypothetical protein
MAKINYADKQDFRTTATSANKKVTAADMNEIKESVNYLYDNTASEWTYTEVDISSAEILTSGSNPVELLPAPGVNKYYDGYMILEYNYITTPYRYTMLSQPCVLIGQKEIDLNNITSQGNDSVISFNFNERDLVGLNNNILFATTNGADPINGDGTIKAKIWYKIITFG